MGVKYSITPTIIIIRIESRGIKCEKMNNTLNQSIFWLILVWKFAFYPLAPKKFKFLLGAGSYYK
jgi:hypothetical protein